MTRENLNSSPILKVEPKGKLTRESVAHTGNVTTDEMQRILRSKHATRNSPEEQEVLEELQIIFHSHRTFLNTDGADRSTDEWQKILDGTRKELSDMVKDWSDTWDAGAFS